MVLHCRWPGVRLWFWSGVAVRLTSSSGLSSPTGGGRHRRSCRAPRSWSAPSRAVQSWSRTSRASPSPPLLSVAGRASGGSASPLSGNWCARRRLRCVSPAGPAPRTGPRVSRPRAGVREARPSFSSGRPGGWRLSQPLLVWAGPLREPVKLCGHPRRGDLHKGCVLTVGPAQRGRDGPWWAAVGPGFFRRPSAPATAQVQDSGGLAGAGLSACWSSPREPRCPRGGGVDRAGVLAASATASEEPWMLAL